MEDILPDTTQAYQSSDSESDILEGSDQSASQDDLYMVNNDDSDCESVSGDVLFTQDTDLDDDFLEHDHGGQIYDIDMEACLALHIQEKHHHDKGHPYHPWETANKVGITNLVYAQAI